MKIKNYLLKARLQQYFQDLKIYFLGLVIFLSLCFFIAVHLESIFFFSAKIRYTTLIFLFSVFIIMLIIFLCIFFLAKKNFLSRYSLNKLAYKIGKNLYPKKPDTILNANQLDEKIHINQSQELARAYVNNVLDKIDPLKFQSIFFNPKIIFMKKLILTSWLFILLGFCLLIGLSTFLLGGSL